MFFAVSYKFIHKIHNRRLALAIDIDDLLRLWFDSVDVFAGNAGLTKKKNRERAADDDERDELHEQLVFERGDLGIGIRIHNYLFRRSGSGFGLKQ